MPLKNPYAAEEAEPESIPAPDAEVFEASAMKNPYRLPDAKPSGARLIAGPQDYLNRPSTIEGLSRMYDEATPSFMPLRASTKPAPERLVPIRSTGLLGDTTLGEDAKDSRGGMSDKAAIPSDSMAIIHTHPFRVEPEPSPQDEKTASNAGMPNFVMSRDAIYVAPPNGKNIKVADISQGKDKKLNIKWDKNNPVITNQTYQP